MEHARKRQLSESEGDEKCLKKRKRDSLLLAIEEKNLEVLKDLISNQGVDVKKNGSFSFVSVDKQRHKIFQVPAVFAALISDQEQMVELLINQHCLFHLREKKSKRNRGTFWKLPIQNKQQLLNVLELVGAACIFHGDAFARKHGWLCWKAAMRMRYPLRGNPILKPTVLQTDLEVRALRGMHEVQNLNELEALRTQKLTRWKMQAFLTSQRILSDYHCFPNGFVIYNLWKILLKSCESRGLTSSRVFVNSIYLVEVFGNSAFMEIAAKNPLRYYDIVYVTLSHIQKIITDESWVESELSKDDPLFTVHHLLPSLRLSMEFQKKIHDYSPCDPNKQLEILESLSTIILCLIKILASITQTEEEILEVKTCVAVYIRTYEYQRAEDKPNLLVKECLSLKIGHRDTDFKVIHLLVTTGANLNSVDDQRHSPLYLLAIRESSLSHLWREPNYSTHATNFTAIVQAILQSGRFFDDQADADGKTAMEIITQFARQYPDPELGRILHNLSKGVWPLACLAAKAVKLHGIPWLHLRGPLESYFNDPRLLTVFRPPG